MTQAVEQRWKDEPVHLVLQQFSRPVCGYDGFAGTYTTDPKLATCEACLRMHANPPRKQPHPQTPAEPVHYYTAAHPGKPRCVPLGEWPALRPKLEAAGYVISDKPWAVSCLLCKVVGGLLKDRAPELRQSLLRLVDEAERHLLADLEEGLDNWRLRQACNVAREALGELPMAWPDPAVQARFPEAERWRQAFLHAQRRLAEVPAEIAAELARIIDTEDGWTFQFGHALDVEGTKAQLLAAIMQGISRYLKPAAGRFPRGAHSLAVAELERLQNAVLEVHDGHLWRNEGLVDFVLRKLKEASDGQARSAAAQGDALHGRGGDGRDAGAGHVQQE